MAVLYTNNASTALASGINNSVTSLSVSSGTGALFPNPSNPDIFYATLTDSSGNVEIVRVTARSTDTFTIVRGQDGTSARSWSAGALVELRVTKAMLDDLKVDVRTVLLGLANTFTASQTIQGNLTLDGTARRITGDFSNAIVASRAMFQSSTANGNTTVSALPNGTATASQFAAYAGSDAGNVPFGALLATATQIQIISNKTGTGTTQSLAFVIDGATRATFGAAGALDLGTGLREARVAMGASDIDLRAGNYFTRTISGATTLTVSNVPAAGTAASFILDLTNGGSATITWWSGMKWAGGTAPTLTSSGRDVLGFFTHDAGTTWTGLLLGKDVK
jgi:hypothetical protein